MQSSYDIAVTSLKYLYIKQTRYLRVSYQLPHYRRMVNLYKYFQALKILSRDCNYKSVDVATYTNESMLCVTGIKSHPVQ